MKFSKNELIEMAVQIEKSGYSFYDEALKKKELSEKGKKILTILRNEEVRHEKYFLSLREELDDLELDDSGDWETISNYIKTITDFRLFNNKDSAVRLAAQAVSEDEIFEYAIRFEKDTILYFYTIKDNVINSDAVKTLKSIIEEEISHVLRLTEYKQSIN
ncbi:MAG: ferritin family protein [Candidatus Cloacimonetes bacterium]|nr:ferritin family protein [Candidatus Cloacimonadota bacterium]MDD4155724.1 ferritin family protein [Candidatus Cloacimonadota bacterium]